MKTGIIFMLAMALAMAAASGVNGQQIMVIDDAASEQQFHEQRQTSFLLGREVFANSTLASDAEASLGSSLLAPGDTVSHFPGGTDTVLGIHIQTNQLGGGPATPAAGGNLFASGRDVWGAGMIRIGPSMDSDSLDLFFDPPDYRGFVRAVSFYGFLDGLSPEVEVRLYDSNNTLLALQQVGGLGSYGTKIGILPAEGESIFRVNLWAPGGSFAEVGEIELYVIPEPAAVATVMAFLALLFAGVRSRRGR